MKKQLSIASVLLIAMASCTNAPIETPHFSQYPTYEGKDLGAVYTKKQTAIKVWSPMAKAMKLRLYEQGQGGTPIEEVAMEQKEGVWQAVLDGDWNGKFYTVQATLSEKQMDEVPDPYAKAVGVNGKRGQIVDLAATNPDGWDKDEWISINQLTDVVLYELHVRDASIHPDAGIANAGKFLGLAEEGTKTSKGASSGLSHIKELGVTHVHLLPVFDFLSVDESQPEKPQYNWGYDPLNYNAPEGSYATDAADGRVRIKEFKQMVHAFHRNGLGVIMDVVYNHTGGDTSTSIFNQIVPGYYYRQDANGGWSNASACGNETASERTMMRKFMLESVLYWATEYHIDGFRFDLMGIHDIETMNLIAKELRAVNPNIVLYGEGWTAGQSPLPEEMQALKKYTYQLDGIAAFSDDIRDALKGSWINTESSGFVSGNPDAKERTKFGIVGAMLHPDIMAKQTQANGEEPWTKDPSQAINYVSCHDNHTLWDRIILSNSQDSEADRIKMALLANTVVLTSQGIPFIHAGAEMLRTKGGEGNSYNLPDSVNAIDWNRKLQYPKVWEYYRKLVALRKNHPAFRMMKASDIRENLQFAVVDDPHVIAYTLKGDAVGDDWREIVVGFNGGREPKKLSLHNRQWKVVLEKQAIDENGLRKFKGGFIEIPPHSAVILVGM